MKSVIKMSIFGMINTEMIEINKESIIQFSDGTIQLNTFPTNYREGSHVLLTAEILDSDGIMALAQVKHVVDTYINGTCTLLLKYLPYARYDRAMKEVDSFSLKVFANIINSLKFDEVQLVDAHSNVGSLLINNCREVISQLDAIKTLNIVEHFDYIISPDYGAIKKANFIAEYYKVPCIIAIKKRNPSTGYTEFDKLILEQDVDLTGKRLLIVDDICDGGATFINLATGIRKNHDVSRISLYVTHGLFSKGKSLEGIDDIFCYNDYSARISKKQ